ncbi:hypothetical protein H3V17_00660 [Bartonella sp. M0283]|uniref:hypothetical protein n=1 Tax=Bartonella sp. M0283 TaxID=2751016 RepID=UPI0018DC0900|nr:hypothetical protein [Bartonella sp. M0283]MBI0162164.1 hypothetical protein [Bartonella sp. M0283]
MAVPYHTHTFEIPTATPQDMAARASNDKAVTPSVLGTAATADRSEFATAEQGKKADNAVQPETLGTLARKNKVVLTEIETNGAPSNTTFLSGNGWQTLTGSGDMTVALYDPSGKRTDAFDMGNMKEAANAKIMTADEREKIANLDKTHLPKTGGTITGNLDVSQDLKGGRSLKTNGWVLIENDGTDGANNYGIRLTVPEKKADHTAEITLGAEGELRFRMASSPSDYALQCYQNGYVRVLSGLIVGDKTNVRTDGNILGSNWINGDLASHIESRCTAFQNACVTDSRVAGWVDVLTPPSPGVGYMPAGYFVAATYYETKFGGLHICGRQPQLYIANRGWYSLGWW